METVLQIPGNPLALDPVQGHMQKGRESAAHQLLCRVLKQTHPSLSPKSLASILAQS